MDGRGSCKFYSCIIGMVLVSGVLAHTRSCTVDNPYRFVSVSSPFFLSFDSIIFFGFSCNGIVGTDVMK